VHSPSGQALLAIRGGSFRAPATTISADHGGKRLKTLLAGCTAVGLLLGAFALAGDRMGFWKPVQATRAPVPAARGGLAFRPTGLAETTTRQSPAYVDQAAPESPSPPLRARTAFLLATLAGIGLLASMSTSLARIVSDVRWALSARVRTARPPSSRANDTRSRTFRPRSRDYARSMRVVPALAALARTVFQTPRRAFAFAIAAGTRARPSFRSPRGIVAFHLSVNRYRRDDVAFYAFAVAVAFAVGLLVAFTTS
jgi:hypothetical protein